MWSYGAIRSLYFGEFDKWELELAEAKDRFGNVLCKYAANDICIKKNGYKFGNGKETMSSVFGKNNAIKTFLVIGYFIYILLDDIETNHCEKSIDNNI